MKIYIVTFNCTAPGCERFEDVFGSEEAAEEYIEERRRPNYYSIQEEQVEA